MLDGVVLQMSMLAELMDAVVLGALMWISSGPYFKDSLIVSPSINPSISSTSECYFFRCKFSDWDS